MINKTEFSVFTERRKYSSTHEKCRSLHCPHLKNGGLKFEIIGT